MTTNVPSHGGTGAQRWLTRAAWLVGGTMAYNLAEAGVALHAGLAARSIALIGFGLDSMIELAAGVVVLHRLAVQSRAESTESLERSERRARRLIGVTFLLLALYVLLQAGWSLLHHEEPGESTLGIVLAALSLVVMPLVAWGKLRAASALASKALRAEAKETLACSYLSLTLLVGLVANAALGWWWADPVAALAMVPWLVHEGLEGLHGEECGCEQED